jgi:hypothetical protein
LLFFFCNVTRMLQRVCSQAHEAQS